MAADLLRRCCHELRDEVDRRGQVRLVDGFDTANAYGPRTVNQIIGRALSPVADDVVIGNKVGAWRDPAGGWTLDPRPETVRAQVRHIGLSRLLARGPP